MQRSNQNSQQQHHAAPQGNSNKLTLSMLIALVAGNMIGGGIFLLPSELARIGNIGLLALLFTSGGALILTWVFTKLNLLVPRAGGPYIYAKEGLGEFLGFQMAWGYYLAAWIGNVAVVVTTVGYLEPFFPGLNHGVAARCITSLTIIWSLTLLNLKGAQCSGRFQLLTTVLRLLPLLLVSLLGYRYFHAEHFTNPVNFNYSGQSHGQAFASATLLTMWLFLGLESATVPTDLVENPRRNVPLASIIGILIAIAAYFIGCSALFGMMPMEQLARSTAPFVLAGQTILGACGKWLIAGGALAASLGCLNGWMLLAAQIPTSATQDGFFPRLHLRPHDLPKAWSLLTAVWMSIAVLVGSYWDVVSQFAVAITLATSFTLLSYFCAVAAGIVILGKSYWQQHLGQLTCFIIALVYSGYAVMGAGGQVAVFLMLAILISIVGYICYRLFSPTLNSTLHSTSRSVRSS